MATKIQILEMLGRIPDDEPLFLLRGQDVLAGKNVAAWVKDAAILGVNETKVIDALRCANAMVGWRPQKTPD